MKENKHIEKELLFKNNIKDIVSISLDILYNVVDNYVEGNYIIDGEYKIHELSINKEQFNFKIPFKYELDTNVNKDTVKLEIDDFTYDYKKDELIVNIDSTLYGDKNDVLEFDSKELLDNYLCDNEVEIIDDRIEDIKNDINKESDFNNEDNLIRTEEEEKKNDILDIDKEIKEEMVDDRNDLKMDEIVNNINNTDSFVTYKVVKMKEDETLESVVLKYHTSLDELKEYNDLNNLSTNDRIIIPYYE